VYTVRGYCAGVLIYKSTLQTVEGEAFEKYKEKIKNRMKRGEMRLGLEQPVNELCLDVYDQNGVWRYDLSFAIKIEVTKTDK
jgi:hypothetical protein